MKKKIFGFMFAFAFIMTGALCLTACGQTKHYYSIDLPEHCEFMDSGYAWDDNGTYVLGGETLEFHINIDEGYYSNDFKLLINSTEVAPTYVDQNTYDDLTIAYSYHYSITPTADFTITASGTFTQVVKQVTLSKAEGHFTEVNADENNLFIRFKPNSYGFPVEETTYANFVKNNLNVNQTRNLPYGSGFSFDVYYKGTDFINAPFVIINSPANCTNEFYHENNEIGYHFVYTQGYQSSTLDFGSWTANRSFSIKTNDFGGGAQYSIIHDKLEILLPEGDSKTLTITLKDYTNIAEDIKTGLRLVINGEDQNINFADSTTGTFEITIKNPWEYSERYDTWYEIDLNFYEFEYFDGVVTLPDVQ